ncbi:unnamed protein product [Heligmosomoides polygyrus]|uniref:Bestrophin homolog n=1 Tax=Heligmosomoides polygyrus TaxID=6339 RepID=A0A183GGV1_HELPZ|nr:unnamed protein product [Heligmosomoides polygyrus]
MLCETRRGHFDLVMTIEDHINLALAQTLVYQILYIDVFKFHPEDIKDSIKRVRMDMDTVGDDVPTPVSDDLLQSSFESSSSKSESSGPAAIRVWRPPMPYSSVKALDPSVYRNLSYDAFLRRRRRDEDNGHMIN